MCMNIYISELNEKNLRHYDGSMSGLVNRLLGDFFEKYPSAATGGEKPIEEAAVPPKLNRLPSSMPKTIEEGNNSKSPGYSAKISPDIPQRANEAWTGPLTKAHQARKGKRVKKDV